MSVTCITSEETKVNEEESKITEMQVVTEENTKVTEDSAKATEIVTPNVVSNVEWLIIPTPKLSDKSLSLLVHSLCLPIVSEKSHKRMISIISLFSRISDNRDGFLTQLVLQTKHMCINVLENLDILATQLSLTSSSSSTSTTANSSILFDATVDFMLLRLLQTMHKLAADETMFDTLCLTIPALETVWMKLNTCLKSLSSCDSAITTPDSNTTTTHIASSSAAPVKSTAKSSTTGYLARFLPLIEAFFVVHTCHYNVRHNNEKDENHTGSNSLTGSSSLEETHCLEVAGVSSTGSDKRLLSFVETNRVLLNLLVKEHPHLLLDSSLTSLVTLSRCRIHVDFDNKRSYFKSQMKKARKNNNPNQRNHPRTLRLQVRRSQVFEDSFNSLRMRTADEMRGRFHITFHQEEGIDAGGLTREWYLILSREIFNPNYALFTTAADSPTFQPNPLSFVNKEHLAYFKFVGRVLGKAICDGQLLDAHFTRSFYKHILGIKISYHDIEAIDPEYYRSLKSMLEHDLSALGLDDLTFSVESAQFGKMETHELKPNGLHEIVTEENKMEYVKLVAHHRMTTGIQSQIDAFLSGFHDLVTPDLISIFNELELELLISGMPEIDIDDLKANTEYANYKPSDSVIRWFWKAMYSFSHEERALFVQFVTGTSKIPLEGFKAIEGMRGPQKFNIHKAFGSSKSTLPSAHTCFNQLDLPEYETEEITRERLLFAIREGSVGFGFG